MDSTLSEPYTKHPLYQLAMTHFQQGEWSAGLMEVEHLVKLYPFEKKLRALRQDVKFRARLDQEEDQELALEKRKRFWRLGLRLALGASVLALLILGVRSYSDWMGAQLGAARASLEHRIQTASLTTSLNDTNAFIRVSRLDEAEALLSEIRTLDPGFPGLEETTAKLGTAVSLQDRYQQATDLMHAGDWLNARELFLAIEAESTNYLNVPMQLAYLEKRTLAGNLLSESEQAFQAEAWEQAVTGFETLRVMHPEFETAQVEARLFESYVNAARSVLIGRADSLEALGTAEDYFRKALSLRPQDPEIKAERELAHLYLKSQSDFAAGRWRDVISGLEVVYNTDADYAQGTARQTLYDAYVARGDSQMSIYALDGALSDYQRAADLAAENPEAVLRLFEAELKMAEGLGAKGDYEGAVVHYRAAVAWGGWKELAAKDNPALASALAEAERYAGTGNFGVAYERYRLAVQTADTSRTTVVHEVQPGEYLTLIASRYGSTASAIAAANAIKDLNLIFPGQELVIPVHP